MTADRSSPKRGLQMAVSVLAAMAVIFSARPAAAGPLSTEQGPGTLVPGAAPRSEPAPTRVEGQIRSIAGDTWQVDDFIVTLSPNLTLNQKRGLAEVGAWVLLVGTQTDQHISADVIEVLRSATSSTPTYQYTGPLHNKPGDTFWFVGDTHIYVTPATQLVGELVQGALVRATVRQVGHELEALEIRAIAADPDSVLVAIKGIVEQVTDTSWVIDGNTIIVPSWLDVAIEQGVMVEVAALNVGGKLVAQQARVVDGSRLASATGYVVYVDGQGEENQTWTMVVFDGSQTTTETIRVTPETYVDEDRATSEPGVEAQVQGDKTAATSVNAALIRLDQPVPATAAGVLTPSRTSALWFVGQERVWFASEMLMKQALTAAGQGDAGSDQLAGAGAAVVVNGVRLSNGVLIAKEVSQAEPGFRSTLPPAAGINAADWWGPNDIAASANGASKPTVLFDAGGGGHAVFESQGVIYYSYQSPGGSWSQPRKIGAGVSPTAVLDAHGLVNVAFRAQFFGNYDIMHVRQQAKGSWTLPIVVAPTSGASADPAIAADATGHVYVVWADLTSGSWAVQLGTWDGRQWTTNPVYYGRGQSPALLVEPSGELFIAWQDRIPTGVNTFGNFEIFAAERKNGEQYTSLPANISANQTYSPGSNSLGVRLTGTADGLVHLAWVDDNRQVRYLFGRTGYWPAPSNVGPQRTLVRGISLESASDGLLYLALDDGEAVSVMATPPRTQNWPDAELIAARSSPTGLVGDVSIRSSADRVVVTWVQANGPGNTGVYESRHATVRQLLRSYMPMVVNP